VTEVDVEPRDEARVKGDHAENAVILMPGVSTRFHHPDVGR
jgi:hypothetical protein